MARKPRLVRGRDYVIEDDGAWEFTREYLLNLGVCCKNECRHCPYQPESEGELHSSGGEGRENLGCQHQHGSVACPD